ncbi:hypothetical protein Tco_0621073 [Tanacetum coccineum]
MASFDYRLNPLYALKECSSYGALYTTDYCCSKGGLVDKIICDLNKTPDSSQRAPHSCAKCGNLIDGPYCRGCALLRKKFREDLFTYCVENGIFQDLQYTSESSNENTNVVNALHRSLRLSYKDPGENSSQTPPHIDHNCAHYGYSCPPKVPNPEPCNNQTVDELPQTLPSFDPTCYSGDGNLFTYDSTPNFINDSPNVFNPPPQPQYVPYSCELCGNNAHHDCGGPHETFQCQPMNYYEPNPCYDSNYFGFDQFQPPQYTVNHPIFNAQNELLNFQNEIMEQMTSICDMVGQYMQKKEEDKRIAEDQAAKDRYWKIPICYDDDEDYTIAITPVLSTEEPVDSLIMEDEHLDTIPATESDEVIKSSVENLVQILSESEGIPDKMCDVPFCDNSPPLDISKDQFEGFSDSNNDSTLIDDDSFSIDDIDYVDASPPDSELVDLEEVKDFHTEDGEIEDDILREKLSKINLLIAKIEAINSNPPPSSDFVTKSPSTFPNSFLEETNTFDNSIPESETFCFDLEENSSGSTTTRSDYSLPDYEAFYFDDDHIEEKSSGSTTTHADFSQYDSFIFDLSINPFPPADRSDFYHEEFADELAHIISPPEYDCFYFKSEPDPGELTSIVDSGIRENVLSTTNVNLPFEDDQSPLLAYVVWIFLPFLTYPVTPPYLLSCGNEDTIFDPGISVYHSFMPSVSHRSGTFMKFNVYPNHLNESPMEILSSTCSPMDQ